MENHYYVDHALVQLYLYSVLRSSARMYWKPQYSPVLLVSVGEESTVRIYLYCKVSARLIKKPFCNVAAY